MDIDRSMVADVPLIAVSGEADHSSRMLLAALFEELLLSQDGSPALLVDLADCIYMDGGAMSVLLLASERLPEGRWLGLVAPSDNILRLFRVVGLDRAERVRVFPSTSEAATVLAAAPKRPASHPPEESTTYKPAKLCGPA